MNLTRRVIAITIATIGCGVLAYLAITGSSEALTALTTILTMVLGFYFGTSKTNQ